MRTKITIINTIIGIISTLVTTVCAFFINKAFIAHIGIEYLGLNGIFSNAIGIMALTELGIGMAISYELYSPLAENDYKKIASLMSLYKNVYHIIAVLTFFIGLILGLFICLNVKVDNIPTSKIFLYFFVFVINNATTYLFAYKRTLLEADQKGYIAY